MTKATPIPFILLSIFAIVALLPFGSPSMAPGQAKIDAGDTAWMLTASALVLLMTPGLSFFYGGMVSFKNVVSTMLRA